METSHVFALAKKEWKRMLREPAFLFMIILFPIIMTVAFGVSFGAVGGSQSTTYNLAVVDLGPSGASTPSHQFAQALEATDVIKVQYFGDNASAQSALSQGKVQGILLLPLPFDASIDSFRSYPSNPRSWANTTVALYLDKGSLLSTQVIPSIVGLTLEHAVLGIGQAQVATPVTVSTPSLVEVEASSVFATFAPGLFAFASIYMIMMVAQSYTAEKEEGLLARVAVTSTTSSDVMLGSVVAYLLIGLLQALLVFLCAYGLGYRPVMNIPGLAMGFIIVTVFAICNIGFGLITAAIARTAGGATGISFVFLMPQLFLGTFVGTALSSTAQVAGRFVPAYYVTDALTSLFARGASAASQAVVSDLVVVAATSLIVLLIGVQLFRSFVKL